jgi:hypothetical protein
MEGGIAMNHTIERHRRLYGLLRDTGTQKYRHELVYSFSHGRTDNSADLSDLEVSELIRHLETMLRDRPRPQAKETRSGVDFRGQKMRRRILSMCHTIGWNTFDPITQKHQVDWARLNAWMLKYGYLHKPLNRYSYAELGRLVTQFENMVSTSITEKV